MDTCPNCCKLVLKSPNQDKLREFFGSYCTCSPEDSAEDVSLKFQESVKESIRQLHELCKLNRINPIVEYCVCPKCLKLGGPRRHDFSIEEQNGSY